MKFFLNSQNQLRNVWWIAIFFLVLASLTFPLILLSQQYAFEVTITQQALVVIAVTWILQAMRKKPMSELLGKLNLDLLKNMLLGFVAGAILMLVPAIILTLSGTVHWQQENMDMSSFLKISAGFISVAIAEEFLFRGFIFQRLRKSTGLWVAQLIIAGYFLLTHIGNPGMTGNIKILAYINIFTASIMFGFAYVRTNSLITPIAFHFMANWVQGTLLGFGVSGNEQASLLKPVFNNAPEWLTGGSFGLEASVPGLISVFIITFILYRWRSNISVTVDNSYKTKKQSYAK